MNEEEIKQLKLERDTAIFVARERLDNIERIQNQKEIFELRYLKADKEIERLNNQLQQKENIIKEVREKVSTLNTKPVNCEDYELRYGDYAITLERKKELLEILDKENKE